MASDIPDSLWRSAIRRLSAMTWDEFVEAARAISWITYLGTADEKGRAHVSAVAPGFGDDRLWVATRPGSRKARNIESNPSVGFHWPVGSPDGPGELAAWGSAVLHGDIETKTRIWNADYFSFDLAGFFGSPDGDVVFIEVTIARARLMTASFESKVFVNP